MSSGQDRRVMLLAGATGLVGGEILRRLARDPRVAQVRALVRRPLAPGDGGARVLE